MVKCRYFVAMNADISIITFCNVGFFWLLLLFTRLCSVAEWSSALAG